MKMACVRESVSTRETGHDIDIHIEKALHEALVEKKVKNG